MTSIVPPPEATRTGGPALRARRCSRHSQREAVARCLSCGGDFCSECVVEHDGKLICAVCLAQTVAEAKAARKRPVGARVRRIFSTAAAFAVLWIVFYELGSYLVRIPAPVHDGTLWKRAAEQFEMDRTHESSP